MRLLTLLLTSLALHATAAPFVPTHDSDVVEQLPKRMGSAVERAQQRQMREQLLRAPNQLPLALQLARNAIVRARQFGDPRELGQVQAALAPWWNQANPPPAVRLLRATVKQSQHDFQAALTDLEALLQHGRTAPLAVQAQAELTRASVLQVLGRLPQAQQGCERLASPRYAELGKAVQLPAQACLAELTSLQGNTNAANKRLRELALRSNDSWLALMRAELAERRGDESAQALYRQALQSPDVYTLAAYADWLLDHHRESEVVALLVGREDADALLLRLAIARQRLNNPEAAPNMATLAARFDAAALRGERSHGREQARFELELKDNPSAALTHAEGNWAMQKEPADALILTRAAQAAGQPQAAEPVWLMVRNAGWQDVRLHAAIARPQAQP